MAEELYQDVGYGSGDVGYGSGDGVMIKELRCTQQELTDWLVSKLDDCPCDWHTQDYYCGEGLSIIFHTEEDSEGEGI